MNLHTALQTRAVGIPNSFHSAENLLHKLATYESHRDKRSENNAEFTFGHRNPKITTEIHLRQPQARFSLYNIGREIQGCRDLLLSRRNCTVTWFHNFCPHLAFAQYITQPNRSEE